tara:strand:+ start:3156 stop:4901 length:1746 start_codon:yes stop_codon:yes gene_type:complete
MCGISGVIKFGAAEVQVSELKRMSNRMVHRGPDGFGLWTNSKKNVGLAHQRLSIIDVTDGGHQPMISKSKRYTITFNGEIYNYLELKEMLQKRGYKFYSDSDTEVLLSMFEWKQEQMMPYLDGMFAIAIWDEQTQRLFCARDRFGEKPFYYTNTKEEFVFASEIKALWEYGVSKAVKSDNLIKFIKTGKLFSDVPNSTFYQHIKELQPSSYFHLVGEEEIVFKKYWKIDYEQQLSFNSESDLIEKYNGLFTQSIRRRLRADVEIGSSLSGGLDSSSIVAKVNKMKRKGQVQKAFSAVFPNFAIDESTYINELVNKYPDIELHTTIPNSQNIFKLLDKAVEAQDEPFGSSSILAQYAVMEIAKKNGVTILLDGQGADEVLSGYVFSYSRYLEQLFYTKPTLYTKERAQFNKHFDGSNIHNDLRAKETVRMRLGRYRRNLIPAKNEYRFRLKEHLYDLTFNGSLKSLLRYADRNSMANSLEVRLPFLSHELVEFIFQLPDKFLLREGWTKWIHRKSTEHILPKSISWRVDKIGFEPPQKSWINNDEVNSIVEKQASFYEVKDYKDEAYLQNIKWRLLLSSYYQ